MITENEKQLEKFLDLKIMIPDLSGSEWRKYFGLQLHSLLKEVSIIDLNFDFIESNHRYSELLNMLEGSLETPRKIKAYLRELRSCLLNYGNYIDYLDLMALIGVKCTNIVYFNQMGKYANDLLSINTTMDLIEQNNSTEPRMNSPDIRRHFLALQ